MEGSESAAAAKEEEGDHQNPLVKKEGGGGGGGFKGKSCKGCLYYSSILKSKSRKPFCVGVSRTLQQGVAFHVIGSSIVVGFILVKLLYELWQLGLQQKKKARPT